MPKVTNTVKLRLYMNNSTELFDPKAIVADTEVLTDLLDGSSFPRRRQPTLTLNHRATGQRPTPGDYEQIENLDPLYADDDPQYMTRAVNSTFRQARQGMHREKAIFSRMNTYLKMVAGIGGTAVLLVSMVVAMVAHQPDETPPDETPVEEPAPTILPVLAPKGGEHAG